MRTQRRPSRTVRIVRTNTVEDKYGNTTEDPRNCVVQNALFEPEAPQERAGDDQVRVLDTGFWNLPGCHQLVADDLITDGDDTWQVIGGGVLWLNRTKVRVQRARRR